MCFCDCSGERIELLVKYQSVSFLVRAALQGVN